MRTSKVMACLGVLALAAGAAPQAGAHPLETAAADAASATRSPLIVPADPPEFHQTCNASHFSTDDPIVAHGVTGPHMHDFFGNSQTDKWSTPTSLRTAVSTTTCASDRPADKAAYWVPSLYVLGASLPATRYAPQFVRSYYLGAGIANLSSIENIPYGLEMVAGNSMSADPQSTDIVNWACLKSTGTEPLFDTIPSGCPVTGDYTGVLRLRVQFPNCWDGVHDYLPGTAHMRYAWQNNDGTKDTSADPSAACPSNYNHPIPQIRLGVQWDVASLGAGGLTGAYVASDPMAGGTSGHSAHGDFMNGWDQTVLDGLIQTCIRNNPQTPPATCNK